MTYHYREGATIKNKNKKWLAIVPVFFLVGGGYMLLNAFAPAMHVLDPNPRATAERLVSKEPEIHENRLYIPKLNVDVVIPEQDAESALERGVWHRAQASGNPEDGGNFVLAGHRFLLGVTPMETRAKSPFYNLESVNPDDEIFVDFNGKRYAYKVTKRFSVDRTRTEIEAPSEVSKITIYSCNIRGEKAGREVIEAKPVGMVAWVDGEPKIVSDSSR